MCPSFSTIAKKFYDIDLLLILQPTRAPFIRLGYFIIFKGVVIIIVYTYTYITTLEIYYDKFREYHFFNILYVIKIYIKI